MSDYVMIARLYVAACAALVAVAWALAIYSVIRSALAHRR